MSVFGLETPPLDEGTVPLEAVVLLKVIDSETGKLCYSVRSTAGMTDFEQIGMLRAECRRIEDAVQAAIRPDNVE